MRFITINKHFLDSRSHKIALLPKFIIYRKAKFQLEVSANKAVIFFPLPEIWTPD